MRFGKTIEERSERWLLIILGVLLLVFAGLQVSSFFGGKSALAMKEKELAQARLMDGLVAEFTGARRLVQEDVGMSGGTLPKSVIEKLGEKYTLTEEDGKIPIGRTTAARLRRDLGIDASTAAFILENQDAQSFDELAKRKRNLFEEHRATIEPLIVQRVSQAARESGIQKIDQFKVEPPKTSRRRTKSKKSRSASNLRPDSATVAEMNTKIAAVRAALDGDETALATALAGVVESAHNDPTIRRTAAAGLEKLLDHEGLTPEQTAQLRLATLQAQPPVWRIASALLKAHLETARRAFPPEPEATGAEDGKTPPEDAASPKGGNAGATANEAKPEGAKEESPPPDDTEAPVSTPEETPIVYEDPPFPALVALPRAVQRRLIDRLIEGGGAWLSEADLRSILERPAPQEKVPDAAAEPSEGDKAEASPETPQKAPNATNEAKAPEDNAANAKSEGPDEGSETAPSAEEIAPLEGPEVEAIRRYQTALVDTLWEVSDIIRSTRGEQGRAFSATLTFQCPLDQLVNLIYKIENESPWMRVRGLRITVADPKQPLLSVTLTMEATVL